jgi:hypothetical protein
MTLYTSLLVYPDGGSQEISHRLRINQLVDVNGLPLNPPLPTPRMLAYRVARIATKEERGEVTTFHHLEQLNVEELGEFCW